MSLRLSSVTELNGAELAAMIAETKQLIEGYHNSIACIRTTLANPQFVERSIADYDKQIALMQQRRADLLDQQANGHPRIEGMKARIVELESDLKTLFNFAKIVQISELAAKLERELGNTRMDIVNQMIQADK